MSKFFQKNRFPQKVFAIAAGSAFAVCALFAPLEDVGIFKISTVQPVSAAGLLRYRGVDVMKWTKDTMRNQPSDQAIAGIVSAIASTIKPTHIAVSMPLDATGDYNSANTPSPRTAEAFTAAWANAIHSQGLKVIWRGTWSGIEGIYDFTKRTGFNRLPAGTAASAPTDGNSTWLGKTYRYILDHPGIFSDGDLWAVLPERTEGIFNDDTSFLPRTEPGIQQRYANFFNDLIFVSQAAFSRIGKNVIAGMTAHNYSEVASTWMYPSVFEKACLIVVDHYGITHTPQEMEADLRAVYAKQRYPVFLQEWGDYWHPEMPSDQRAAYLQQMYGVLKKLVNEGILIGFNYWGAWGGDREGILDQINSTTFMVNSRGRLLAQFFAESAGTSQVYTSAPSSSVGTASTVSTSPSISGTTSVSAQSLTVSQADTGSSGSVILPPPPPPAPSFDGPGGGSPSPSPSVVLPYNSQAGDVIKFSDSQTVYLIKSSGLYPFDTYTSYQNYIASSGRQLRQYPGASTPFTISSVRAREILGQTGSSFANGSLVNDQGTIYLIRAGTKLPFTNFDAFRDLGYSLKNVVAGDTSSIPLGNFQITAATSGHPWGSWVLHNRTVYYVHSDGLIGIPTYDIFLNNGGRAEIILPAVNADLQKLQSLPAPTVLQAGDARVYR